MIVKVLLLAAALSCTFCLQAQHDSPVYLACPGNGSEYTCKDEKGGSFGTIMRRHRKLYFTAPDDLILDECTQRSETKAECSTKDGHLAFIHGNFDKNGQELLLVDAADNIIGHLYISESIIIVDMLR